MNASLIVNPAAGNKAYRHISSLEALLKKRALLSTFVTGKKGDAFLFAKELAGSDRVIVAGGDGTFNEVINGVLSSLNMQIKEVPLALIPLGTTNVLAKELHIPEQIERAADLALTGKAHRIALGRINGWSFASMAGIGFDAETVLGVRNNLIKKISGKAAHIVSGLKVLRKYNPPIIKIRYSGGELTGYTVVIGNARSYGGYFQVTPQASITEPMLDVCIFKGIKKHDILRFIAGVIRKSHLRFKDVSYFKASELEIISEGTVHVQVDGDYFGTLPAKVDVIKDAVNLIW